MSTAISQNHASHSWPPGVRTLRANVGQAFGTEGARSLDVSRGSPVLDWFDRQLLDACRRDFPICERPFAEIGRRLNGRAGDVLRRFEELERRGVVNRIGPVLAPEFAGASTLLAMAVPRTRLRSTREALIRYPGVNDICEREHEFNFWFALAAPTAGELYDTVTDIRRRTGVEVLDLRLERVYCGDVGFPSRRRTAFGICGGATETSTACGRTAPDAADTRLLTAIREGLPVTGRPYAVVGKRLGISEAQVIERLKDLLSQGLIARMGVVLRDDSPGSGADALVVFHVARHTVDRVGERLAEASWINRCHRCIPRAPIWPYNLYCTLHDRDLARLICWVDEEFFGTVRCPRRAVLFRRAYYGTCVEN
ncbi:MAG: hypothetical protein OXU77_22235 [Gammaproteobacteria bacterium]|nr:hypothetical protein [Gammaproteobacteria bacterium]